MMKRTRIDKAKEIKVRDSSEQKTNFKPVGFWYSVEGDWERWCEEESPGWLVGCHVHEVTMGEEVMLEIRTGADLDLFHRSYREDGPLGHWYIDWPRVAENFDGIEIAPYQWDRRNFGEARWYYTWDCASGCIWRPRGVEVKLLR